CDNERVSMNALSVLEDDSVWVEFGNFCLFAQFNAQRFGVLDERRDDAAAFGITRDWIEKAVLKSFRSEHRKAFVKIRRIETIERVMMFLQQPCAFVFKVPRLHRVPANE